jgi:hypothetical protein
MMPANIKMTGKLSKSLIKMGKGEGAKGKAKSLMIWSRLLIRLLTDQSTGWRQSLSGKHSAQRMAHSGRTGLPQSGRYAKDERLRMKGKE